MKFEKNNEYDVADITLSSYFLTEEQGYRMFHHW